MSDVARIMRIRAQLLIRHEWVNLADSRTPKANAEQPLPGYIPVIIDYRMLSQKRAPWQNPAPGLAQTAAVRS